MKRNAAEFLIGLGLGLVVMPIVTLILLEIQVRREMGMIMPAQAS